MTDSEKDPDTQLPRVVSLGSVLGAIRVSPQDAARFLGDMANHYVGGTHHTLGVALRDHSRMVADPQSYGWSPDERHATPAGPPPIEQRPDYGTGAPVPAGPPERPQTPPAARAEATTPEGQNAFQPNVFALQSAPAARAEATTPGTLATPAATPSEQGRAFLAPQPTTPPTPPDADAAGKASEGVRPLGMDDTSGGNEPSNAA